MKKTFEEFRFFDKTSKEELKKKYLLKLDEEYKEFIDFKKEARYGTKREGAFNEFLQYIIYFIKYLKKLYELTDIENPDNIFKETSKFFNEIAESINVFRGMKVMGSLHMYDVKKIYSFYNKFCEYYNLDPEYFGWIEK